MTMTPEQWMNKNYGTGQTQTLAIIKKPAHRRSILTKYARELMIVNIAEMILQGKQRSDIINTIHNTYNYSINTCKDLICEGQTLAAQQFTPEELQLAKRQIKAISEEIMFSPEELSFVRLKAGELLGKITGAFKPEIAIQNNIYNIDSKPMTDEELLALKAISQKKTDEV